MWSLLRAAGQTGGPFPAAMLWQLDVILAPRAEVSSCAGLNSTDTHGGTCSRVCPFVCVQVCARLPHKHAQQLRAWRRPVTRLTKPANS